jgi:predicted molibdopterin-dependent oxidoreductase YjgC
VLRALAPDGLWLEIHPDDAASRHIEAGAPVAVRSRRGTVVARALVVPTVGKGQVFLPMHDARTNVLTVAAVDPHSRQPAYKYSAVEVASPEPWELQQT